MCPALLLVVAQNALEITLGFQCDLLSQTHNMYTATQQIMAYVVISEPQKKKKQKIPMRNKFKSQNVSKT